MTTTSGFRQGRGHGGTSIAGFADNLEVGLGGQCVYHRLAHHGMVFYDDDSQRN
jgi:hypothetical protein